MLSVSSSAVMLARPTRAMLRERTQGHAVKLLLCNLQLFLCISWQQDILCLKVVEAGSTGRGGPPGFTLNLSGTSNRPHLKHFTESTGLLRCAVHFRMQQIFWLLIVLLTQTRREIYFREAEEKLIVSTETHSAAAEASPAAALVGNLQAGALDNSVDVLSQIFALQENTQRLPGNDRTGVRIHLKTNLTLPNYF